MKVLVMTVAIPVAPPTKASLHYHVKKAAVWSSVFECR